MLVWPASGERPFAGRSQPQPGYRGETVHSNSRSWDHLNETFYRL
jgi:hypothetical protein